MHLTALRVAAKKPDWASYNTAAFEHVINLLRSQELPRFDAMLYAYCTDAQMSAALTAVHSKRQLYRLMAEATSQHDEAKIRALAGLLRLLHSRAWRAPEMKNVFCALPSRYHDPGFMAVVAEECGLEIPGDEEMTYEERRAFRKNLLQDYLHRHLEPQLADALLDRDTEYYRNAYLRLHSPVEYPALRSREAGGIALILLALVFAALLLELPFGLQPKPFVLAEDRVWRRGSGFWLVLGLVTACMFLAVFSALDAVCQPADLWANSRKSTFTPLEENLLWAIALSLGWPVVRLLIHCRPSFLVVYARLALILGIMYVAATAVAAFFRHETMRVILEEVLGGYPS